MPDEGLAVAVYFPLGYWDDIMVGAHKHHAGQFTLNNFRITSNMWNPAGYRLVLNVMADAQGGAQPFQSLPANYNAELNTLGD